MKNLPLLLISLGITFAAVIGVSLLFTKKANAPVVPVAANLLVPADAHRMGPTDAKVTLVEFSDFQCPACKATKPLVDQIVKQYEGKIQVVYRFFPLRQVHLHAAIGARAAEAAGKQNAFFQYGDVLFDKQTDWAEAKDPTVLFKQYAKDLKLNEAQFAKDLADTKLDEHIVKDEADGNTIGVNATPTFYVNGLQTQAQDLSSAIQKAMQ